MVDMIQYMLMKFQIELHHLDILKEFEKEGYIGKVFEYFYTTTGTGTSVGNAIKFGTEIGKELKESGVDGVILTST